MIFWLDFFFIQYIYRWFLAYRNWISFKGILQIAFDDYIFFWVDQMIEEFEDIWERNRKSKEKNDYLKEEFLDRSIYRFQLKEKGNHFFFCYCLRLHLKARRRIIVNLIVDSNMWLMWPSDVSVTILLALITLQEGEAFEIDLIDDSATWRNEVCFILKWKTSWTLTTRLCYDKRRGSIRAHIKYFRGLFTSTPFRILIDIFLAPTIVTFNSLLVLISIWKLFSNSAFPFSVRI